MYTHTYIHRHDDDDDDDNNGILDDDENNIRKFWTKITWRWLKMILFLHGKIEYFVNLWKREGSWTWQPENQLQM